MLLVNADNYNNREEENHKCNGITLKVIILAFV